MKEGHFCKSCRWATEEAPRRAGHCDRCARPGIQPLDPSEVAALVEAGDLQFCKACKLYHGVR